MSMIRTRLAGLHPVPADLTDDDTQPGLRGKPIRRTYKVRFSSTEVAPHEFPMFPYALTYVQSSDIVFTAIVEGDDLEEALQRISKVFAMPTILQVTSDSNAFGENDILPGSQVRGFIQLERKRGFFARLFGFTE